MKKFWLGVGFVILIGISFISGFYIKKYVNPHNVINDTTFVYDTVWHHIADTFPYYVVHNDTIIFNDTLPIHIDNKVIKDYFAKHVYTRNWSDTLLKVTLIDTVTQNRFAGNNFKYKILKPQEIIIDKSVHYNSYVWIGGGVNTGGIKLTSINALYGNNKYAAGLGYAPFNNSISLEFYINLFKFK